MASWIEKNRRFLFGKGDPPSGARVVSDRYRLPELLKIDRDLEAELASRPAHLRLPRKGGRFRVLRPTQVNLATWLSIEGFPETLVPIDVRPYVLREGELLCLDYEPVPSESTHCNLIPERYEQLEAELVEARFRDDKCYLGFCFSVSYVQLDADFEWLVV
jgi:hypothetical protein